MACQERRVGAEIMKQRKGTWRKGGGGRGGREGREGEGGNVREGEGGTSLLGRGIKILFSNRLRTASSNSWGLLVAAMTRILSPASAVICETEPTLLHTVDNTFSSHRSPPTSY